MTSNTAAMPTQERVGRCKLARPLTQDDDLKILGTTRTNSQSCHRREETVQDTKTWIFSDRPASCLVNTHDRVSGTHRRQAQVNEPRRRERLRPSALVYLLW